MQVLDSFGYLSLQRLIKLISNIFSANDEVPVRRRKLKAQPRSQAMIRGGLMRSVRKANSPPERSISPVERLLQSADAPLFLLELNEFLSIFFDFNFGEGRKELMLGLKFHFDTDDSVAAS